MGFKSVMKKVGKVALTAAPYIAAPFTGGASLALTGLANQAVNKWSEHDAKNAIAHGLAPSKFDSVLGKVGNISSLASSFIPTNALGSIGMLGKAAKASQAAAKAGKVAGAASTVSKLGKAANVVNKINQGAHIAGAVLPAVAAARGAGGGGYQQSGLGPSSLPGQSGQSGQSGGQAVSRNAGAVMPRGGYRYKDNPMNQLDQSNPNLSQSIFQGKQEAIRNQPFRKGYDVTTRVGEPDEEGKYETRVTKMPQIFSGNDNPTRRKRQQAAV